MPLLVSDDASPCSSDDVLRDVESDVVTVVRHRANAGIARGLNDGLRYALEIGASWLFTFDQDTEVSRDYLVEMRNAIELVGDSTFGALGTERISLTSGNMHYPVSGNFDGLPTTEEIIQTGTAWNVAALSRVGGFDERLGIDAVDAAACLRLRERGYQIGLVPGTVLEHQLGAANSVTVFGRDVLVTGHSPERRASMIRNRLSLLPAEFRMSPRHALRTMRRVVVNQSLGLLLEGDRWAKVRGSARGLAPRNSDSLGS
jgi:rhamnosyltransferase